MLPHGRFLAGNVAGELVVVEHTPDSGEESRLFSSERGATSGGLRKRPQLFADEIVERALRAEVLFDTPRRSALFDPNLLEAHEREMLSSGYLTCKHAQILA